MSMEPLTFSVFLGGNRSLISQKVQSNKSNLPD